MSTVSFHRKFYIMELSEFFKNCEKVAKDTIEENGVVLQHRIKSLTFLTGGS